jgi:hypothetical protein
MSLTLEEKLQTGKELNVVSYSSTTKYLAENYMKLIPNFL